MASGKKHESKKKDKKNKKGETREERRERRKAKKANTRKRCHEEKFDSPDTPSTVHAVISPNQSPSQSQNQSPQMTLNVNISGSSSHSSPISGSSSGSSPECIPIIRKREPEEHSQTSPVVAARHKKEALQVKKGNVGDFRVQGNPWLEETSAKQQTVVDPPRSRKEKRNEKRKPTTGSRKPLGVEVKHEEKDKWERFMESQAIGYPKRLEVLHKCTETAWQALIDTEQLQTEKNGSQWMRAEKARAAKKNIGDRYDDFRSLCQFFWNVVNNRQQEPDASWEIFNFHAVPAGNMLVTLREMGFMAAHRDQKLKAIRDTQLITYVSQTLTLVECLGREWDEGRALLAELSAMVAANGTGRVHSTLHARQNFFGMLGTMAEDGKTSAKTREISYGTLNNAIKAIDENAPGVLSALLQEYEAVDNQRLAIAATLPIVFKHVWKYANDNRAGI